MLYFQRFFIAFFICGSALAQTPTVGLIMSSSETTGGYSLFTTELTQEVYLIDNCGRVVKKWTFNSEPGLTTYLLENGNVLLAGQDSLEIRDWNDNPIWSYATTDNGIKQHHDIHPLPNGNVICIASEPKSQSEQYAAGRDSALISANFRMDRIVELQPIGAHGANIVWEWYFFDHLIQDYDSTKNNFGVVQLHPELIDFNFDHGYNDDWSHLNSIFFDPVLDQIIVSSRNMSELYIIDHSTTTTEAAGHAGGNAGMGGDILWRWGNKAVYRAGGPADQRLFKQHDAKIIRDGGPQDGKISVFNNGGDGTYSYSSINLLVPERNGYNYLMSATSYLPFDPEHSWNGDAVSPILSSDKKCGVQYLPNNHKLVCDTPNGRMFELSANDTVVWTYINPVNSTGIYAQFSVPSPTTNSIFRVHKYAETYAAFQGQTLNPMDIIENQNSVSAACTDYTGTEELSQDFHYANPVINGQLKWSSDVPVNSMDLLNLQGQMLNTPLSLSAGQMDVRHLSSGWYVLRVQTERGDSVHRVLIEND
ncbi:MAG: hypothetical protein A3D92_01905 [Bacteroidetes bacterium RIFCSPHIGHO2_02_FULL_44_7]|nr:MAG: hypothetical protein A3D92_01905 [Bacteroidetes bacterium RIFCSPHIGHO2_02_FULL_44_7]